MKKLKFSDIIIFEDDNYIVVNKPPLMATLDDRAESINLLLLAREYCSDAQVCHRLDKETSGALLIAKNPDAYRSASMQFEKREVTKIYHAVAEGIHSFTDEVVNQSLQVTGKGHVRASFRNAQLGGQGKEAITTFNTIRAYKSHTLIECKPLTGRMHQIRVHLASLNASIVNDDMYGGKPLLLSSLKKNYNLKKWTEELSLINRFALHAFELKFRGLNDELIHVKAEYPKDFRVLVEQLKKNC